MATDLSDDLHDHLALIGLEAAAHARTAAVAIAFALTGVVSGVLAAVSLSVLLVVLAWDEPYRNTVAVGVVAFWFCLGALTTVLSIKALRRLRQPFRVSRSVLSDDMRVLRDLWREAQS